MFGHDDDLEVEWSLAQWPTIIDTDRLSHDLNVALSDDNRATPDTVRTTWKEHAPLKPETADLDEPEPFALDSKSKKASRATTVREVDRENYSDITLPMQVHLLPQVVGDGNGSAGTGCHCLSSERSPRSLDSTASSHYSGLCFIC